MAQTLDQRNESHPRPILEVKNLSVTYNPATELIRAVRGVSFQIQEGETLALVGETGSGKSTVALAVLGLLDHQIQSGEILFRNRGMQSLTERDWRRIRGRQIGMVFQDARSALNPVLTILGHMIETLVAHNAIRKKDARTKAMDLLREVGIGNGQEKLYPFELSGGTCQRAGIALGICNEPRLLIADEPTSSIDTALQAQILDLLQSMKQRHNLSLLLISHDLPLISHVSDRIAVMYHGRVVESGLKEEVLAAPAHPYTQALLQCQPTLQHRHDTNPVAAIPGAVPSAGQEFPGCAFAPRCSRSGPPCLESVPAARRLSANRWVECIRPGVGI